MLRVKSRFRLIFLILACCGILLLAMNAFARERVSWAQLPYYLESQGVILKDLPLCDCPEGLNQNSPSHHVVQIIGNTRYEWKEYEFINDVGKTQIAVQMLRPEKRWLSAAEARVLLSASTGMPVKKSRVREGALETTPIPEEPLEGLMRGRSGSRTATKIDDFRAKVALSAMTDLPFLSTVFLEMTFKGDSFRGSGFLIAPNCVLTAGHNVYEADLSGLGNGYWADDVTVVPGLYEAANGVDLVKPYGQQTIVDDLNTNTVFKNDTNDLSEYDYGAIILDRPFPGIDTFMPLEFDNLPDTVITVGYPGHPYGMEDSYDMWFSFARVLGTRGEHNRIINFAGYVSSGNSGGPIAYYNDAVKGYRLIGVVTWEDAQYDSGVRFTSSNHDIIMSWLQEGSPDYDYEHDYYVPYYLSGSGVWTGLALANHNSGENHILVQYFTAQGRTAGGSSLTLAANAQKAFPCTPDGSDSTGWIKVSATLPVYGLALVGDSSPSTMFDMDLQGSLHKKFIFPHLAADGKDWKSKAMLCNPGENIARVTFTYYSEDGATAVEKSVEVAKHGNADVDLKALFVQNLNNGHILVQSTQPLAAFLLYDSSVYGHNNWKAGLSATPLD